METKVFISMTKHELEELIINCVNSCLKKEINKIDKKAEDIYFNIQEAAEFLHLSIPTIYLKSKNGEIPSKKRSKRLYFSKLELIEYLNDKTTKKTSKTK